MRLKEKKLLQKFAATLKKFSAQGAKKVKYGKLFDKELEIWENHTFPLYEFPETSRNSRGAWHTLYAL